MIIFGSNSVTLLYVHLPCDHSRFMRQSFLVGSSPLVSRGAVQDDGQSKAKYSSSGRAVRLCRFASCYARLLR
jgi:hypothetical protein